MGVVGLAIAGYLTAVNFGLLVGGWTVGAIFLVVIVTSYLLGPVVGALLPKANPMAPATSEGNTVPHQAGEFSPSAQLTTAHQNATPRDTEEEHA